MAPEDSGGGEGQTPQTPVASPLRVYGLVPVLKFSLGGKARGNIYFHGLRLSHVGLHCDIALVRGNIRVDRVRQTDTLRDIFMRFVRA